MSTETDIKNVRAGEELNAANLIEFLRDKLNLNGALEIRQFPAGASNLTYFLKIAEQEFVLRRPPFGNTIKSAHDMKREFRVLSALSKVYAPAPAPIICSDDEQIIGAEFYLMERKTGLILRGENVPENLTESTELQRKTVDNFVDNLAALHNLDYQSAGLGDLGKPEGYAARQTTGWTERYFKAKTDELPDIETTIEWLNANIPNQNSPRPALVHNDYKFDNVMLNNEDLTEIVGVLDWEMCTIGEPLMDLGTTLGYWMSKDAPEFLLKMPFNPRVLMENVTRREICERYATKTSADLSNIVFYYVFGTFKIAVIAQQIYARYKKGLTTDARFAHFDKFVQALGKIAADAIDKDEI